MSDPNGLQRIRERVAARRIGWGWPLVMAFIRLPLILVGIAIAFGIYIIGGADHPFLSALLTASLVTVIVNLVSIALLRRLTMREGIALRDLIGFDRSRALPDLAWGVALLILLNVPFIVAIVVGAVLLGGVAGGGDFGTAMSAVFAGPLADASIVPGVPTWVAIVAAILFPLVNPIVEEMHYRGYVQPRLEALSGSGRFAIGVMAIGFGLQHMTYALSIPGTLVYAAAFLVWGIGAGIVYARMRRLTSLIVVHFVINASTAVVPLIFLLVG
ncbi:MAG: CPBP family intramembrane glutamic endopeptidase [Chloroflexota bacterium]